MRATPWEYRLRFLLHLLIFVIGFVPFWEGWLGLSTRTVWLTLSATFARQGWLGFQAATLALLGCSIALTAVGAWLRIWGSAYVGAAVVSSPAMQGNSMVADGPFRHTRNPLYLGTLLHTFGVSLLMPPAGAIFCIAAIWILQVRLALAEEPFLAARFGSAYTSYAARVPRFLPSPRPLVGAAGTRAHWIPALLGEAYMLGVVITLAIFGWGFNLQPLYRGILISLGISLVLHALMPKPAQRSASQPA